MHRNSKLTVQCPLCNSTSPLMENTHYKCPNCSWDSSLGTVDILYSDSSSSVLSNLFPHSFYFYTSDTDSTHCLSMESFIQSLRVKDPLLQKFICENYFGPMAQKLKVALRDWREDGLVYWNGIAIRRDSLTYDELITTAYDCLFESNPVFSQLVLPAFKDKILIHSIGKDSKTETLLTEQEFRFQLNRLMQRLKPCDET